MGEVGAEKSFHIELTMLNIITEASRGDREKIRCI